MREREREILFFFFFSHIRPIFFPHYYYCHLVAFPDIRRIESPIPPFLIEWKIKVTRSMKKISPAGTTRCIPASIWFCSISFFFFSFWADLFLFYLLLSTIILFLFGALSLYSCYVCVCVCVILAGPLSYHCSPAWNRRFFFLLLLLSFIFSLRCARVRLEV